MDVFENMPRERARQLFWQGYTVAEIARMLKQKPATVYSWARRGQWRHAPPHERVGITLDQRLNLLITKEDKSAKELHEIEVLTRQLKETARIEKFRANGRESDLNPALENRNRGKKKQRHKNFLGEDDKIRLQKAWQRDLFAYQRVWQAARKTCRTRNILKSRQIGATWYFAREAFTDALESGDNQIFISASRAQAEVFRHYILEFVREVTGKELKGNPIVLDNKATLYFLSTNVRTAQSYHGHLYVDEYFWIPKFRELQKVASGMAAHKKWRKTYFSTPSTLAHEAYPFWSGKQFNAGRAKEEHVSLDVSRQALKDGSVCADGQWRQMMTVEEAVQGGCTLFDVEKLRLEYSPADFANLFLCRFVDDAASVFRLSALQKCMVDTWSVWDDFFPEKKRPFGDRKVWIGYDPSRSRDDASVIVVAPPGEPGGKFRVLEKHRWADMPFSGQAGEIRKLVRQRYNVEHIAIDASGPGLGVYELVKGFFPRATKIIYSVEVKNGLVLKAQQLIDHRRIEFDAGWTDLAQAFMTIHRSMTPSGKQITFQASRTAQTGHADMAWALMHALVKEAILPLDETGRGRGARMETF